MVFAALFFSRSCFISSLCSFMSFERASISSFMFFISSAISVFVSLLGACFFLLGAV